MPYYRVRRRGVKGRNYRIPHGMPYTRREYIAGAPHAKVAKYSTGTPSGDYDVKLQLISNERAQIRDNALEATRVAINKNMGRLGERSFYLVLKAHPHVVLRENKMIATAGADRLQEGMRKAFGKCVGLAARVSPGTVIFELSVKREHVAKAKKILKSASNKLPVTTTIKEVQLKPMAQVEGEVA